MNESQAQVEKKIDDFQDIKMGFVLTGSHCTLEKAIKEIEKLKNLGADITPIISESVKNFDTRFGKADFWKQKILKASGKGELIDTINKAEPIGPEEMFDILVVAPCSGNTLGKIVSGITDTTALMAIKAHLRSAKPVVIAISTNDGLANSCKNIGLLLNTKNFYFVPFGQDNPEDKNNSLVASMEKLQITIKKALKSQQVQPILLQYHK